MGVDVRLILYAPSEAVANDAAAKAFARIAVLNSVFSDYDPESEAMRLVRNGPVGQPLPISQDLWSVLRTSDMLANQSCGAFDVTIGHVSKLWRRSRRQKQRPDAALLAAALEKTGWQNLKLDPEQPRVTLQRSDLQLDFGGIAKGYAAAEALNVLKKQGVSRAMVLVAGDIAAGDPPPEEIGWRVGIAPLDEPQGTPSCWLKLVNASVSTSGDIFQSVEIDGVRYSHIVDPRTGVGLTQHSSVTVVTDLGPLADGLSTAVSVLGPIEGLMLLNTLKADGHFVIDNAGTVITTETRDWSKRVWPVGNKPSTP